jgi:serine/threonine-protein kinase
LWEALTGQRLFQGTDDGDVYAKVLLGKVDPPSLYARELSPAIDEIVMRGLARDKTQRFATAREMALALEAAIPLAPPSQVGTWVEGLVGDSLAERTQQIAGIERLDDGGDTRMTSSALMSIGGGIPAPSNEKKPLGSGGTLVSRMDRTAPTQPIGLLAAGAREPHVTVVDRPERTPAPADSIGAVAGLPPRRRRRGLLMVGLVLIPVAAFGAWRGTRGDSAVAAAPRVAAQPAYVPTPSAALSSIRPSTDWVPVPIEAMQTGGPTEAPSGRKAVAVQAPTSRPALLRSPTAPQASESSEIAPAASTAHGNGASCDPPFWIDSDGTKRYNRHCANL